MALALIALMLIELLLLSAWVPLFFQTGIVLFNQRIAASPDDLKHLSLGGLEHDLPIEKWARLSFHALPDGSVAFRESFVPGFGGRYFPLMHGQLVIDRRRREVRVIGRCSWFALVLTVLLVPIVLLRPMAWPMLAIPLLFRIGYRIQRWRYANVVEAVRAGAAGVSVAVHGRTAVDPRHAWMGANAGIRSDQRSAPTKAKPGSRSTPCVDEYGRITIFGLIAWTVNDPPFIVKGRFRFRSAR